MMKDMAQIKRLEDLHFQGALLILVRLLTNNFLEILESSLRKLLFMKYSSSSFLGILHAIVCVYN